MSFAAWCLALACLQAPAQDPHDAGGARRKLAMPSSPITVATPPASHPPTPGARLVADTAEVEIGEPVSWTLDVEHDAGSSVRVLETFALGGPWVLLDAPTVLRGADPSRPGRVHTLARFRALALEPGELAPTLSGLDLATESERAPIVPAPTPVRVRAALAEGEDAPRPLQGFRPIPTAGEPSTRGAWILAALAAALVAFVVWRLARRRPAPAALPPLTPLAQLEAIAKALAANEGVIGRERVAVYDLSRLLRSSVDAFLGVERAALTDAEWSAAVQPDERVPLGVRNTAVRTLARAETIKYALAAPTKFAVDEFLADARSALEALAVTPPPPPQPPQAAFPSAPAPASTPKDVAA